MSKRTTYTPEVRGAVRFGPGSEHTQHQANPEPDPHPNLGFSEPDPERTGPGVRSGPVRVRMGFGPEPRHP